VPATVVTPEDLAAALAVRDARLAALEADRPTPSPQPEPTPTPEPRRWLSGVGTHDPYAFGTWRGRAVDVWETWGPQDSWPVMLGLPTVRQYFLGGKPAPFGQRFPGRMSFSVPLWARGESAAVTASGRNDENFRALFTGLMNLGHGNAFVRLGWEFNGDWFYWHATDANAADWVKGFRRVYKVAKEVSPGFEVVWNPNKSSNYGFDARRCWPGADCVDVAGPDWYNTYPATHSWSQWDAQYMATGAGGAPVGLGAWRAFTRAEGVISFCLPEWGQDAGPGFNSRDGSGDDPHYIELIHRFCSDPENGVTYESLFNLRGRNFQLYPPDLFPRSSARYADLFGRA
jgi:hypothetical protein